MENEQNSSYLKFDPQRIDFGDLPSGQGAKATLSVLGGPGSVSVASSQLVVTPLTFQQENSTIEIVLSGGSTGELLWDDLVLKTEKQEARVLVTARWGEYKSEKRKAMGNTVEAPEIIKNETSTTIEEPKITTIEPKPITDDTRTFKGRSCSRCGKNFAYDANSMSWEECKCNQFQVLANLGVKVYKDVRLGIKESPLYIKEVWHIITGKEKL